MLESLPKFAEILLSNSADMLPRITTAPPMAVGNPRVVTQDPSTLALAMVGFATLAIYLAATGWRKPRRDEGHMSRPRVDIPDQPRPTDRSETPTRDAA